MKILFITRSYAYKPGGGSFHVANMAECLKENGHDFVPLVLSGELDEPLSSTEMAHVEEACRVYGPDVAIADYSWMAQAFDAVSPLVKKIIFVHDLRCRIIPALTSIGYEDKQGWNEKKEAALLRKSDVLMVLNKEDGDMCRRLTGRPKIIRIGIAMKPVARDPEKEVFGRLIYVASDNLENKYALDQFDPVWNRIKEAVPDASISICLGHPDSLEEEYAKAQIAVVPHIMPGGLKIKTAEAFAHGLPVVGNVCAFDGFPDTMGVATDDPDVMVNQIVHLLQNKEARNYYATRSQWACANYLAPEIAYGELLQELS